MDNLTHTFVGAALAEAGLKRRTALGAATLMIGANFPDIDVIAVPLGVGIEVRRGITHGIPAHFVLPFVLAWIMWQWDRHVRRRLDPVAARADFRQLTILSAIAIATHPALDFMNTYGMRWLMPFVDKWYYADGLFIVDVWILGALVVGFLWSCSSGTTRPARVVLAGLVLYTTAMLAVTGIGRMRVAAEHPGRRFMVAPVELVPWQRHVILEEGTRYRLGSYSLFDGVSMHPSTLLKGEEDPAVPLARRTPKGQRFLGWARFPIYRVARTADATVVRIADIRYAGDAATGWASVEVRLPPTVGAR